MAQTRYGIPVVRKCVAADGNYQAIMPDPLSPFDYERVSMKWAKAVLIKDSWKTALIAASGVTAVPVLTCIAKLTLCFKVQGP